MLNANKETRTSFGGGGCFGGGEDFLLFPDFIKHDVIMLLLYFTIRSGASSPNLELTSHPAPVLTLSKSNNQIPAGMRACTSENTLTSRTFTVFTIPEFHSFLEVLQIF